MKTKIYTTLLTTVWANQTDPGVYSTMLSNTTSDHRYQPQLQHDKRQRIYKNIGTMDKALNNQVIDSVKDTYLKELNIKYTGFLGVTCHNIFEHLLDRCGRITTMDLETHN